MVPGRWLVLTVRSGAEGAELLADALVTLGGRAVSEESDGFTTHLPEPADPEAFVAEAAERLREISGLPELELEWGWQEQEEWAEVWKRGLAPRRITERVTVAPSWDLPEAGEGEIVVTLDPGLAFGTAEHATTRGCVRLLDRTVTAGDTIADVGCGSGILSIVAAKLGAGSVRAIDSDPFATAAARENVALNGVGSVDVVEAVATPEVVARTAPLDGIVANIESGVLLPLLPAFAAALEPGGWLVTGGVLRSEREEFLAGADAAGLRLDDEDREEEWWCARFRVPG
jgi:ribosomal protein L11 methyltransferase